MSDSCADVIWMQDRIAVTKALIVKYETAIDLLSTDQAATYSIDTGQTRTSVTKVQIPSLMLTVQRLESRLAIYETRLYGSSLYGRPHW